MWESDRKTGLHFVCFQLFVSFKWWACSCVNLLLRRHLIPDSYNFISSLHPCHQNHRKCLGVQGLRTVWVRGGGGRKQKEKSQPRFKVAFRKEWCSCQRGSGKLLDRLTEIKKTSYLPVYFKGYNQLPHEEVLREVRKDPNTGTSGSMKLGCTTLPAHPHSRQLQSSSDLIVQEFL